LINSQRNRRNVIGLLVLETTKYYHFKNKNTFMKIKQSLLNTVLPQHNNNYTN